ncbi:MAG: SDR family NAD(P)-dependent oxidoreductase [Amylibacter sp.]
MTNTALITGASAGIGAKFARYHAAKGGDVILTARRVKTLNALKLEFEPAHKITAHVFAADLAITGAALKLYQDVTAAGLKVDVLINNAGFGGIGIHTDLPLDQEFEMIDLNVKALVILTHKFGCNMAASVVVKSSMSAPPLALCRGQINPSISPPKHS